MKKIKKVYLQQKKRYLKRIQGSTEKPRLSIFKSQNHIYAQLIDDKRAHTVAFSSTLDKNIVAMLVEKNASPTEAAFLVGQELAKKALEKQITQVVFDRGVHPYHGRVKRLAEGSRLTGLYF